jgi:hypothetical protein
MGAMAGIDDSMDRMHLNARADAISDRIGIGERGRDVLSLDSSSKRSQ